MTMKIGATAAVACLVAAASAGAAIAQTAWPQLTRGDLEACRTVIAQVHKAEFAYIEGEVAHYCSANSKYRDAQNCKTEQDWLAETKAADDVAWFFKGNDHCEGSDYPCFGPGLFNDARTGEDAASWSQRFAEMAAEGTAIAPGMELWDAAFKADNCLAGLWVKKARAAGFKPAATAVAKPAPKATPAPAPTKITASDPTLQSNLKTYAADQLLALTNEFIQTGDIDLAKLARNALLQRFPDSPLVPIVAQLITNASKPGAPAASPAPAPAPASTSSAAAGRVQLNTLPQITAAFARFGVVMNPVAGSTVEAQESNNYFSGYLSDCRSDGHCWGIQLQSRYAFSPMPGADLVQSWNRNKLYGRAYISGDRVSFDMVLRVPQEGVDIDALSDFVTLYKDASTAFYNMVKPQ
jgi:hypothetical protein